MKWEKKKKPLSPVTAVAHRVALAPSATTPAPAVALGKEIIGFGHHLKLQLFKTNKSESHVEIKYSPHPSWGTLWQNGQDGRTGSTPEQITLITSEKRWKGC